MYKWVDERGMVSYSNTPPTGTTKKVEAVPERVSVYTPDAAPQRLSGDDLFKLPSVLPGFTVRVREFFE